MPEISREKHRARPSSPPAKGELEGVFLGLVALKAVIV